MVPIGTTRARFLGHEFHDTLGLDPKVVIDLHWHPFLDVRGMFQGEEDVDG